MLFRPGTDLALLLGCQVTNFCNNLRAGSHVQDMKGQQLPHSSFSLLWVQKSPRQLGSSHLCIISHTCKVKTNNYTFCIPPKFGGLIDRQNCSWGQEQSTLGSWGRLQAFLINPFQIRFPSLLALFVSFIVHACCVICHYQGRSSINY